MGNVVSTGSFLLGLFTLSASNLVPVSLVLLTSFHSDSSITALADEEEEEGEGKTEREWGGGNRAVSLTCISVNITATPAFVTAKQEGRSLRNRAKKKKTHQQ